jgi:hypothetical protein
MWYCSKLNAHFERASSEGILSLSFLLDSDLVLVYTNFVYRSSLCSFKLFLQDHLFIPSTCSHYPRTPTHVIPSFELGSIVLLNTSPPAETMKNHYRNLALCRVPYSLPSATQKTLGKRKHSAKKLFAECFIFDTRQRVSLPSVFFWHSAKGSMPSVTNTTLGKELFAECFFSNTRQRQFKNHILK